MDLWGGIRKKRTAAGVQAGGDVILDQTNGNDKREIGISKR